MGLVASTGLVSGLLSTGWAGAGATVFAGFVFGLGFAVGLVAFGVEDLMEVVGFVGLV